MKNRIYIIFVGLVLIFASVSLEASHVVGGQITYKCLGNDRYEVTLEFRRDCFLGDPLAQFDDPVHLGIFDSEGNMVFSVGNAGELIIDFSDDDTLNEILTSECRVLGDDVCVQTTTYQKEITLPFREGGYTIAYQRCCRNASLNNIVDPSQNGATYFAVISEKSLLECNSSPRFNQWPNVYICANEELVFDHSATDVDGDELRYRLCTPFSGGSPDDAQPLPAAGPPYNNIDWAPGFDLSNLMGGTPLEIDSITGELTAIPGFTGQYVIGVCVEEYRDGVLLTQTIRDFQYNVRICERDPIAEFEVSTEMNCEGLDIAFTNNSTQNVIYEWFFDQNDPTAISTDYNTSYTYPEAGLYDVKLIVYNGDCVDSTMVTVGVAEEGDPNVSFEVEYEACADNLVININDLTMTNQELTVQEWTFSLGANSFTLDGPQDMVELDAPGTYEISYFVETVSGCTGTFAQSFNFELEQEIELQLAAEGNFCEDQFSLNIDAEGEYAWYADEELQELLSTDNPVSFNSVDFMASDSVYVVQMNTACDNFTVVPLSIVNSTSLFNLPPAMDVCSDAEVELNPDGNPDFTYSWSSMPAGIVEDPTEANPIVNLTDEAEFYVEVVVNSSCILFDTILITPFAVSVDIQTPSDSLFYCDSTNFNLTATLEMGNSIVWIDGNGDTLGTEAILNYTPGDSTVITAISENAIGCTEMDQIFVGSGIVELEHERDTVFFCDGFDLDLMVEADNFSSIIWTDEEGNTLGMGENIMISPTDTSLVTVTATNDLGCSQTDEFLLVPDIIILSFVIDSLFYCEGDNITLMTEAETPVGEFSWISGTGELIGTGNPVAYTPSGAEDIFVIGATPNGCEAADKISIRPYEYDAEIKGDNILCLEEVNTLTIENNTHDQDFTYEWEPEEVIQQNNGNSIDILLTEDTEFTVTSTNQDGCVFQTSYTVMLNEFSGLDIDATAESNSILLTESTQLSVDEIEGAEYIWDPAESLDDPTVSDPVASPTDELVTYTVTVIDENGCVAMDTVSISVVQPLCDETDVFVPNLFTPNDDDFNDVFRVEGNFIDELRMIIYNRWGEQVFESDSQDNAWDGTFKGTELEADVYGYHLTVRCINGQTLVKQGNVTLMK